MSPEEIEAYEEARRAGSTLVISLGEANPVAQEAFAKAGAVPRLVDALMTGSEKSKSAAAMAVRVLASLPANQQAIPGEGAVAPLVELLGSQSPVAMEAAAGALGMLASRQVQANQTAIAEAGGVPALARVLAAGDVSARIEAADAIRHLVAGHRANQDLVAHEEHALHG